MFKRTKLAIYIYIYIKRGIDDTYFDEWSPHEQGFQQ